MPPLANEKAFHQIFREETIVQNRSPCPPDCTCLVHIGCLQQEAGRRNLQHAHKLHMAVLSYPRVLPKPGFRLPLF